MPGRFLLSFFKQIPIENVKNLPQPIFFQKNKKGTQPMPKGKSRVPYFVTIFMLEKHQKPLSTVTISPVLSKKN